MNALNNFSCNNWRFKISVKYRKKTGCELGKARWHCHRKQIYFSYHAVNCFIFIFSDVNLAHFPWALNCWHVWSVSVFMWEKEREKMCHFIPLQSSHSRCHGPSCHVSHLWPDKGRMKTWWCVRASLGCLCRNLCSRVWCKAQCDLLYCTYRKKRQKPIYYDF